MTKKYHGKYILPTIKPKNGEEALIIVQTASQNINFILKIFEAYSHLAIPVQLDPAQGLLGFHTPKDQQENVLEVLRNIPRHLEIKNF